jgi:hypothetical protein
VALGLSLFFLLLLLKTLKMSYYGSDSRMLSESADDLRSDNEYDTSCSEDYVNDDHMIGDGDENPQDSDQVCDASFVVSALKCRTTLPSCLSQCQRPLL